MNPDSPVKISRTLIDATVAGTPTQAEWPILRPENELSASTIASFVGDPNSSDNPFDGVFDPSAQNPEHDGDAVISVRGNSREAEESEYIQAHNSKASNIGTGASAYIDAFPNTQDDVLGSQVPHKQTHQDQAESVGVATSRHLSKSAIPVPKNLHTCPRLRRAQRGSTKWPLLDIESPPNTLSPLTGHLQNDSKDINPQWPCSSEEGCSPVSEFKSLDQSSSLRQALDVSPLSSKTSESSSTEKLPDPDARFGSRVKRLSNHSLKSGLGPVLTISDDADGVLLGTSSPIPDVPPLPNVTSQKPPQGRSLSALAGRITRERIPSSFSSRSRRSRSGTPQYSECGTGGFGSTRILPIRSMELPRKSSVASDPKPSPSSASNPQDIMKTTQRCTPNLLHSREEFPPPHSGVSSKLQSAAEGLVPIQKAQFSVQNTRKPTRGTHPTSAPVPLRDKGRIASNGANNIEVPRPVQFLGGQPFETKCFRRGNSTSNPRVDSPTSYGDCASGGSRSSILLQAGRPSTEPHQSRQARSTPVISIMPNQPNPAAASHRVPILRDQTQMKAPKFDFVPSPEPIVNPDGGTSKVKLKKSFRNFFQKKENKQITTTAGLKEPKRLSVTMQGSALAKRFRSSVNLSKATGSKESQLQLQSDAGKDQSPVRNADNLVVGLPNSTSPTAEVVYPLSSIPSSDIIAEIMNYINSLPPDSIDRLKGLQIAQVLVQAIEQVKQAKIAAQKAKEYARDAALHANTADITLKMVQSLVGSKVPLDTVEGIVELISHSASSTATQAPLS
ncbi:uncharacterized protein BDR25DRAFT_28659 [Lindgomyces ingoldianus]|uniref:Uncharacterized protein n=1 Tax=Lindgomyces ingoldianus TaxID=673940 RepID=A0ACB6QVF9_9PLEO|nr:uncharacterized protein BDR25DRAFT_28659 [Lindgomyces ingoldianus]KAF2470973.1 hypothetical protein BDR25DRAFT_28659 [Lindgomyces ingoldianus]